MYTLSLLTGNEYYNGILIPQDDTNELFQQRCDFLENGGQFEIIESTPEEIAEANKIIIQQNIENIKQQQFEELSKTDWYYTRHIETGQEVPLEIKQQRLDIREKYNNLIREINNE